LTVTDADHDGRLDVVATGSGAPSVMAAWRNTGEPFNGGWLQVTIGNPSSTILALTTADFDRDGEDDFVTATGDTGIGGLLFWTNALIRPSIRSRTPNIPPPDNQHTADALSGAEFGTHAIDIHDMNRDGRPDIVVATVDGSLMILQNNGSPFAGSWPSSTVGSSFGFFSVAVGDLDSDGWPAIATGTTLSTTGAVTTALVHIWRHNGDPFSGSWISQTAGTLPRPVMDLALGDVGREGHLQIVASTGVTDTFADYTEHDVPTSDDNRIWLLRPPAGDPFASSWISSTVCTTTYSANSVALGDLDNDGWLDVVFGTDHAPLGTTGYPNTEGFYDGPAYHVRACRNLGNPYSPTGWQVYDVGRDDAPISIAINHHSFWGAHVYSVAVGDLDNDGYLDVTSGSGAGDYQIQVYRNNGAPFDGNLWEPTFVGYGLRYEDEGPHSCPGVPGTYPEDCPWIEHGISAVHMGDLNGDGWLDLISGFASSTTDLPLWINTGVPFGETVTDTHWIRHNIDAVAICPVHGVETADLDSDGRLDVVAADYCTSGSGISRVWRNLGGIARHTFHTRYSLPTIENGASESGITFAITHNGRSYDHDLELESLKVLLYASGRMDSTDAAALFQSLQIYRDANSDSIWQLSDSPVVTLTDFSPITDGYITLTLPSGNPLAAISPSQTVTYFIVLNMQPTASQASENTFRMQYIPHAALLIKDKDTQASVSLEEDARVFTRWSGITAVPAPAASVVMTAHPTTIWANGTSTSTITATVTTAHGYPALGGEVITFTTSAGALPASPYYTTTTTADGAATAVLTSSTDLTTATVTGTASITATDTVTVAFVVGPRASLRINETVGSGGNEVTTHTMTTDDNFTVYAAAYDTFGRFMDNPTDVTWGGTGVVSGNISPTVGANSTTFAPVLVGTGTITVTDGNGHVDGTGTITVGMGTLASIVIRDATGGGGSVVDTHNMTTDDTFIVYAAGYDTDLNYISDITVTWSTSGTLDSIPAGPATSATFSPSTAGTSGAINADDGDSHTDTTGAITVNPGSLGSFAVTAPSPQRTGLAFTVTVTAYDSFSNIKTDYTGVVTFTSSDIQAMLPTDDGIGWSDGGKDFSLKFRTTGEQTYTAHDGAVSQESDSITVNLGPPASFSVTSPTPQMAGTPFTITVTARDASNDPITDYIGPVSFTSNDPQAVLPTDDGTGWSDGSKEFTLEFRTTGVQTYTVRDVLVSQESAGITVNPGLLGSFAVTAPSPQQAGAPFSVTVTAYDSFSNLKTDYTGTVNFTTSDLQAVLPTDDGAGWSNGAKDFTLELRTTGVQTYSVQAGDVVQNSTDITVTPGALASLVLQDAAGGSGNEVITHTMTTNDSFTVYAAGYDTYTNYISDIVVTWSTSGDLDSIPPGPAISTTFAPTTAETSGAITANDGNGHTTATGIITVTHPPNYCPLDHCVFLPFVSRQ